MPSQATSANTNRRRARAKDDLLAVAQALDALAKRRELEAERSTLLRVGQALHGCAQRLEDFSFLSEQAANREPDSAEAMISPSGASPSIIVAPELFLPSPQNLRIEAPSVSPGPNSGSGAKPSTSQRSERAISTMRFEETTRFLTPGASVRLMLATSFTRCHDAVDRLLSSPVPRRSTNRKAAPRRAAHKDSSQMFAWLMLFSCGVMLSVLGGAILGRSERAAAARALAPMSNAEVMAPRSALARAPTRPPPDLANVTVTPLADTPSAPHTSSKSAITRPRVTHVRVVWGQATVRDVTRALRHASDTAEPCFAEIAHGDPQASRKFSASVNVSRSGRAQRVQLEPSSDSKVAECLREAIQSTSFPRANSGMLVRATFTRR